MQKWYENKKLLNTFIVLMCTSFIRLLFLPMEMGVAFNVVSWHSDYGERCRKNHDADAGEKE